MRPLHITEIQIDLRQFQKNIKSIKKIIGNHLFCLPVKADAYGHGLIQIAKAAVKTGVDYLAVACLKEGMALRKSGVEIPILVLDAFFEKQIPYLIEYRLQPTIHSLQHAEMLKQFCKKNGCRCRVHLKIDTGMCRLGVKAKEALKLWEFVKNEKLIEVGGLFSHLASSEKKNDPLTKKQIALFKKIYQKIKKDNPKIIGHLANSGALLNYPSAYFDMVRPGILAYGYMPDGCSSKPFGIDSCFALKSKIAFKKQIKKGEGISYNHTHIAYKKTKIATIPVGYGDGYKRILSNQAEVLIKGRRFPIVGTICMDMLLVDIKNQLCSIGDEVVLIGKQGKEEITVEEIASFCGTIPYEITCSFTKRISKIYIE